MKTAPRTKRSVARVLLFDERGRLLLLFDPDPEQGGYWYPPGGRIEPGESPEEAARRELIEELGLDVPNLGPVLLRRRASSRTVAGGSTRTSGIYSGVSRRRWSARAVRAMGRLRRWPRTVGGPSRTFALPGSVSSRKAWRRSWSGSRSRQRRDQNSPPSSAAAARARSEAAATPEPASDAARAGFLGRFKWG